MRPFIALVLLCLLAHMGTADHENNGTAEHSGETENEEGEEAVADDVETSSGDSSKDTDVTDNDESDAGARSGTVTSETTVVEEADSNGGTSSEQTEESQISAITSAGASDAATLVQYLSKANTAMQSINTRLSSAEARYHKKVWILDAGLKLMKANLANYVMPTGCETAQKQNMKTWDEVGGIAAVYSYAMSKSINVYCDMTTEGGGWTVFQRRVDGSVNFYRDWDDYTYGFGEKKGEFWLGLMNLHQLTKRGKYELRIEMTDWDDNKAYANYGKFSVGNGKGKYVLTVDDYTGDAGDSLSAHTGMKFTTKDEDNDVDDGNCAAKSNGGFWYTKCHQSNPNGLFIKGGGKTPWGRGINWKTWMGYEYSLKTLEMKFRKTN